MTEEITEQDIRAMTRRVRRELTSLRKSLQAVAEALQKSTMDVGLSQFTIDNKRITTCARAGTWPGELDTLAYTSLRFSNYWHAVYITGSSRANDYRILMENRLGRSVDIISLAAPQFTKPHTWAVTRGRGRKRNSLTSYCLSTFYGYAHARLQLTLEETASSRRPGQSRRASQKAGAREPTS